MQQLSNVAFLTAISVQCSTILNAKFSQELELVLFSSRTETVFGDGGRALSGAQFTRPHQTRQNSLVRVVSGVPV